jgi:catechol 2,3-dioxygenase-like lactoylglutathione lyase family enzyme
MPRPYAALDHVSIPVADLAASRRFYDAALAALDMKVVKEFADAIGYGRSHPIFWLHRADPARRARPGLGLHICFGAETRAAVGRFHAAALAHGAQDNGAAGLRPHYHAHYYGAFVFDPDGYKIEAACHAEEA